MKEDIVYHPPWTGYICKTESVSEPNTCKRFNIESHNAAFNWTLSATND